MTKHEDIRMTLSILQMGRMQALITPKAKKHAPFICKVKDFVYGGEGTRAILKRIDGTVFPGENVDARVDEYVMLIKDIKAVDKHEQAARQGTTATRTRTPGAAAPERGAEAPHGERALSAQDEPQAGPAPLQWVVDMSGANDDDSPVGSETKSWQATQVARGCRDLSLAPGLLAFTASTADARQKRQAYQLMLFILANTGDAGLAQQLAGRIATEDGDDDCLHTLLIGLWESRVRLTEHLEQVLANVDDPREMVRCAAIRLVRNYDEGHAAAERALVEVVKSAHDSWDLRYAAETLGSIGGAASLEALEQAGEETEDDEAGEAIHLAIRQIRARTA